MGDLDLKICPSGCTKQFYMHKNYMIINQVLRKISKKMFFGFIIFFTPILLDNVVVNSHVPFMTQNYEGTPRTWDLSGQSPPPLLSCKNVCPTKIIGFHICPGHCQLRKPLLEPLPFKTEVSWNISISHCNSNQSCSVPLSMPSLNHHCFQPQLSIKLNKNITIHWVWSSPNNATIN